MGSRRWGPCVSRWGLLMGLSLTCMVRVQSLYAPSAPVFGPDRGIGLGGSRGAGVMRLRGGLRFEEVKDAEDMVKLPLDKAGNKKKRKQPLTPIELEVAEMLFAAREESGLRMLKYLHIVSAMEIELGSSGERAVVIMLPYVEMMEYRKIESILRPKMEQAFKAHIVWIRHRRILREEKGGKRLLNQKRPMSRSMTAVHNAYLDDLVYPHEVVGKQREYDPGVKMPMHVVFLDPKTRDQTEHKLEMYRVVYQRLTARKCYFDYLEYPEGPELDRQRAPNVVPVDSAGYEPIHFKAMPLLPDGKLPESYLNGPPGLLPKVTAAGEEEEKADDSMVEGETESTELSAWEEFPGKVTEGWRPARRVREAPPPPKRMSSRASQSLDESVAGEGEERRGEEGSAGGEEDAGEEDGADDEEELDGEEPEDDEEEEGR